MVRLTIVISSCVIALISTILPFELGYDCGVSCCIYGYFSLHCYPLDFNQAFIDECSCPFHAEEGCLPICCPTLCSVNDTLPQKIPYHPLQNDGDGDRDIKIVSPPRTNRRLGYDNRVCHLYEVQGEMSGSST